MATTSAPVIDQDYQIEREKSLGIVVVDMLSNVITTQRADSLAQGMFASGVRLFWKSADGKSRWYKTEWAEAL